MQWPANMTVRPIQAWPTELTKARKRSNFSASWSDTLELLSRELRAINAKNIVLQVAMQESDFRIDGYPRAQAKAAHPGVILSLESTVGPLSWPCDTFTTWQDNIRGIALSMEALRKVDRYGVTKRGEQYRGWRQLGSTASAPTKFGTTEAALDFLGDLLGIDIVNTDLDIRVIYRRAQAAAHPDRHKNDRTVWDQVEAAGEVLRAEKLVA
ncbi:DnaJ-like chaperonin [Gordonia phage LitninMcQueen]